MSSMSFKCRAIAISNDNIIGIRTYTGYRLAFSDPNVEPMLLAWGASNEVIGAAVRTSIARSKHLSLEESKILQRDVQEDYERFVSLMMEYSKISNRRSLFKNMKSCSIEIDNGKIIIKPSHHDRVEGWSGDGIGADKYVIVPEESSDFEIAAALRLAFDRCT